MIVYVVVQTGIDYDTGYGLADFQDVFVFANKDAANNFANESIGGQSGKQVVEREVRE
jgi:hypothetical protein